MRHRHVILALTALLGGCALGTSGARLSRVAATRDVALSADYRMVFKRNRDDGRVYCAEPSPDIGRVVSAASNASLTGSAKGLAKVQPELALALAASRAEGLAQLGQRLATIQLLRDSTFRACEAYANGAIGPSTYAMIVSRYDDVMVTLLLGEMAAGAARPPAAALLAGDADASGLSSETGDAAVKLATTRMEKATAAREAATAARAKLKADAPEADKAAAAQALAVAQKEYDEASAMLRASLAAVGGTKASTAPVGGGEAPTTPGSIVAQQLATMQRNYLEDFNLDAVTVGCLSALSQLDWPARARATQAAADRQAPKATRKTSDAANAASVAAEAIPQGAGVANGGGATGFASSEAAGAYSLQDECRAILLNGQTLRAAARARLEQIARGTSGTAKN